MQILLNNSLYEIILGLGTQSNDLFFYNIKVRGFGSIIVINSAVFNIKEQVTRMCRSYPIMAKSCYFKSDQIMLAIIIIWYNLTTIWGPIFKCRVIFTYISVHHTCDAI